MSAIIRQLPVVHRPSFHDPAWREQFDREVEAFDAMLRTPPPRTRPLVVIDNTKADAEFEWTMAHVFAAMACSFEQLIVAYRQGEE